MPRRSEKKADKKTGKIRKVEGPSEGRRRPWHSEVTLKVHEQADADGHLLGAALRLRNESTYQSRSRYRRKQRL